MRKLCAWSLGMYCLLFSPACTTNVISAPTSETQSLHHEEILQKLGQADVIYLGETHDSLEDHQAQLDIIQSLYSQNPKIAVAMEMFQHPFQDVLDAYLAGEITEAQLIEQTEYEQRWGFPWEYYAPILRFAQAQNLPVLAINTPTEITRKVAQEGLESLTNDEKAQIPPLSEIDRQSPAYRQMLREVYEMHAHGGHGNSDSFERFFTAQVLWDETMAFHIAQFLQANPNYQVIVLAGKGHIVYGYGIPNRVARRLQDSNFVQYSVLFNPSPDELVKEGEIADYFWNSYE